MQIWAVKRYYKFVYERDVFFVVVKSSAKSDNLCINTHFIIPIIYKNAIKTSFSI